jgi:hypothetical protein
MVRLVYDGYRRITSAMGKNQEFLFANSLPEAQSIISRERSKLQ